MTKHIIYKYIINHSNLRSFLTLSVYIFLDTISIKNYCIFFIYKVTNLNIKNFSYPSNEIFNLNIKIPVMRHLDLQILSAINYLNFSCY